MSSITSPPRVFHRAKRVTRACDYCRKKRLKCTPDQRPCLNCQLYHTQCTSSDRDRRAVVRYTRKSNEPEVATSDDVVHTTESITSNRDSGVDVGFTPTAPSAGATTEDVNSAFENTLPASSWSHDNLENGQEPQDFDDLLRKLGVGVSSNCWDPENPSAPTPTHLVNTEGLFLDLTNLDVGEDLTIQPEVLCNESLNNTSPLAAQTLPSSTSTTSLANGKVSDIESLTRANETASSTQRTVPPAVFVRKNDTMVHYIGLTSTGATLAMCLTDGIKSQKLSVEPPCFDFLVEASSRVEEAGLSPLHHPSAGMLPPKDTAIRCVQAYFRTVNKFIPILDEASFIPRSESFYASDKHQLDVLNYSLFLLILTIGALSEKQTSETSANLDQLAADSYRKAWSMTPDAFASPCESSLQILMLHIVHHLRFGRHGIAWTYCGLAIRIAQSLGLHQRSPPEMGFSKSRISLRSRLWCLILGFDASLSLSQGRSPGLSNGMFEKNMALEYTSTLAEGEYSELADYLVWWYQLSLIQIHFCTLMQSKHSIISRVDGIAQADHRLSAWKESLPPACRPDSMLLTQNSFRCHALMLHLEYYNFLRTIHLAATVMTTSLGGSTEPSPASRFQGSEAICVGASRSFIQSLNNSVGYTKANTHILSFHVNNYMAAIAVLYRSIMKDPSNMSSRADLEYLRAGKMHLYLDMPDNVSGPALKALFDNMLSSAEEMVSKHSIGAGSRR